MQKIVVVSLLCVSSQIFAQKSFFGVEAGVNVANQRTAFTYTSTGFNTNGISFGFNTITPAFGAFYHREMSGILALRLNARYMALGDNHKGTQGNDVRINYFTTSVGLHYRITDKLSINAGPYVSFTLGGDKINNQSITTYYHKNDFGFNMGAEQDITKKMAIGLSYIIGLKNIWLNDTVYNSPPNFTMQTHTTNRALQFTLIYKFKKPS